VIEFEATITEAPRGGAFVVVPEEVVERLGGGGRIPVSARFDGEPYRGSIVRMGGEPILGVLKEIRDRLGKGPGDRLFVSVDRDEAPRVVELPEELAAVLAENPRARAAFDALSHSHRREHAAYVAEAKQESTRKRRAQTTLDRLLG
jgi:hypothetical protein